MARFLRRRSAAPLVRAPQRRKIDIARKGTVGQAIANNTVALSFPLSAYEAALGIANPPAGCTIMAIRYRLFVSTSLAVTGPLATMWWGFIVAPSSSSSTQLNPSTDPHLDWMEWGRAAPSLAANSTFEPVGRGDQGYRHVRSRRKISGPTEDLFFAIIVNAAGGPTYSYDLSSSVVLALA